MNCRRVSSLISAYIDGELTGVEMLEIRRHLDECKSCMLQYESLRNVKHLLSHLAYAEPRVGLADRISKRLDEVAIPGYVRFWNRVWASTHARLTPVAAGCVAIGAMFVMLASSPTTQAPAMFASSPHPTLYASTIQLPPLSAESEDSILPASSEKHMGLVPEQEPVQNDSGIFYLTSFDYGTH